MHIRRGMNLTVYRPNCLKPIQAPEFHYRCFVSNRAIYLAETTQADPCFLLFSLYNWSSSTALRVLPICYPKFFDGAKIVEGAPDE